MKILKNKEILLLVVFILLFSTYVKAGEVLPKSGQESYTVQKGDTLWEISGDHLSNPFFWPKLWARNPKLSNPHVIYPSTELNLMPIETKKRIVEKVIVKEVIKEEVEQAPSSKKMVKSVVKTEVPKKTVDAPGLTKSASATYMESASGEREFVSDLVEKNALATVGYLTYSKPEEVAIIQGGLDSMIMLQEGSIFYIDEGSGSELNEGDEFTVISYGEPLRDKAGNFQGYVIKILGEAKIKNVLSEYQSKAVVTKCYDSIQRGDFLVPLFRIDEKVRINDDVPEVDDMQVVAARERLTAIGTKDIIYLNKGALNGIKAGNMFEVYRSKYLSRHPRFKNSKVWLPEEKVGIVTVIYTTEETSTAVVSYAAKEIMLSDSVRKSK